MAVINKSSVSHGSDKQKQCFIVFKKGGSVKTFAFLGEGLSETLIDLHFYNQIGLPGRKEPLELRWTCNTTGVTEESVKIDIEVSGAQIGVRFTLHDVRNLGLPEQSMDFDVIVKHNPHLKVLPIDS